MAHAKAIKRLPDDYYAPFISHYSKKSRPNTIRSLLSLEKTPGVISLLAGKPNPTTFPFEALQFTVRAPTSDGSSEPQNIALSPQALSEGLQYSGTDGLASLKAWLAGLQERVHGRKQGVEEGWRIAIGSGSQDMIFKALQCLVNPGDSILVQSPVYAGVLPIFHSLECEQIEIATDDQGMSSSSLRSTLENWPPGKPKPKVLYTIPYGCNPTGMTATLERRQEVLQLAKEHDFLILEDDAYFYLYYGDAPRAPSYFSLERTELGEVGRVLRFDSFSKILSAGIRIGFASGPDVLVNAIDRYTSTSNLQTSSLTQVLLHALLESWGYDGFLQHTQNVSKFYREKRDVFEAALNRHLDGLVEWSSPEAGMFFWMKLLVHNDGDDDSEHIILSKAFEKGVLALPGTIFLPNGGKTAYVRAAFSLLEEDEVDEACKRLRETILEARVLREA